MCKKILLFDSDTLCHPPLIDLFERQGAAYAIETQEDTFFRQLTFKRPWDEVAVNFQAAFPTSDGVAITTFVEKVLQKHPKQFQFIGITGMPKQKDILQSLGVRVYFKGYDPHTFFFSNESAPIEGITIPFIKQVVAAELSIPQEKIDIRTRKREIVEARQVSMYLSKLHTKHTLKFIGQQSSGRDHTTVRHAIQVVKNLMDVDAEFRKKIVKIEDHLKIAC